MGPLSIIDNKHIEINSSHKNLKIPLCKLACSTAKRISFTKPDKLLNLKLKIFRTHSHILSSFSIIFSSANYSECWSLLGSHLVLSLKRAPPLQILITAIYNDKAFYHTATNSFLIKRVTMKTLIIDLIHFIH